MSWSFCCHRWMLLIVLMALATAAASSRADVPAGTIAVVTDIHFNPFAAPDLALPLAASGPSEWPAIFASAAAQSLPGWGEDTNQALLASALAALSGRAANADLVVVSGDLLAHGFQETAAQLLGTPPASGVVHALASKTALYVADALRATLPGKPILIALGNNDSECGDYQLEPGGPFLTSLRDTVRELAGPDRLGPDFDRTYMAGGYYVMRHPNLAETPILVINDVLWSASYQDSCGSEAVQAGQVMMDWFERQLADAHAAGQRVWLVHHIPIGIDSYSTVNASTKSSCPAQVTPFLREPFASRFGELLRDYAAIIQASFSGHTHQDDYRLVRNNGVAVLVEKVAPSISPIFGNNPGFHLFDYNRQTGDLMDFSTWYLANFEQASATNPAVWGREYVFTEAYNQPVYAATTVERILEAVLDTSVAGDQVRNTYRRLYPASHGEISAATLPAYACSIGNLDVSSYVACYCDK